MRGTFLRYRAIRSSSVSESGSINACFVMPLLSFFATALFDKICVLLVLSGKGPVQLLLFGGADFVAAVWTAVALKQKAGAV